MSYDQEMDTQFRAAAGVPRLSARAWVAINAVEAMGEALSVAEVLLVWPKLTAEQRVISIAAVLMTEGGKSPTVGAVAQRLRLEPSDVVAALKGCPMELSSDKRGCAAEDFEITPSQEMAYGRGL